MKFNSLILSVMLALVICSCSLNDECRIHGTLPSDKYDGNYIFLVPVFNTDSVGVDSTKIVGREFELVTSKHVVADIRLPYRVRYGIQNLLVVTEPGDVFASIDTISKGWGTPQNDSIQMWKNSTMNFRSRYASFSRAAHEAQQSGDTVSYGAFKSQMESVREEYIRQTHALADNMEGSILSDFLNRQFPR